MHRTDGRTDRVQRLMRLSQRGPHNKGTSEDLMGRLGRMILLLYPVSCSAVFPCYSYGRAADVAGAAMGP